MRERDKLKIKGECSVVCLFIYRVYILFDHLYVFFYSILVLSIYFIFNWLFIFLINIVGIDFYGFIFSKNKFFLKTIILYYCYKIYLLKEEEEKKLSNFIF